MPTYQYQCLSCGHELEEFQSITEAPLTRCPACKTDNLTRIMGTGAGLIFKGSGFYLTDYKKSGSAPRGESSGAADTPKKETKAESGKKPEGGTTQTTASS